MSGHSKWHNIQAKKGKADAQRGAVFTKIGREIAIAVREGGANPESNGKLRDIIAKAKANNMPNDNIQRSIKKASGELSNVVYEEIVYEGYAPGGVAVIVDNISDPSLLLQVRRKPGDHRFRGLHVRYPGRAGGGASARHGRGRRDDAGPGLRRRRCEGR